MSINCPNWGELGSLSITARPYAPYPWSQLSTNETRGSSVYPSPGYVISTPIILAVSLISENIPVVSCVPICSPSSLKIPISVIPPSKSWVSSFSIKLPNIFGPFCKPNYNSFIATFCDKIFLIKNE